MRQQIMRLVENVNVQIVVAIAAFLIVGAFVGGGYKQLQKEDVERKLLAAESNARTKEDFRWSDQHTSIGKLMYWIAEKKYVAHLECKSRYISNPQRQTIVTQLWKISPDDLSPLLEFPNEFKTKMSLEINGEAIPLKLVQHWDDAVSQKRFMGEHFYGKIAKVLEYGEMTSEYVPVRLLMDGKWQSVECIWTYDKRRR